MTQSLESTEPVASEPATDKPHLAKVAEPSVADLQVQALQDRLVESEDHRKEERFLWFAFSGALVLVIAYALSTAAGVVLTPIYLALLLVLSRKWGFEAFWEAMYEAKRLVSSKKNGEEE